MSVTPLPRRPDADDPAQLMGRMASIEDELEAMMNEWAQAEEQLARVTARIERLAAPRRLMLKRNPPAGIAKPTVQDLDAALLDWLWTEHEQEMTDQVDADARVTACKTIFKVAERALSSKQSRLKAEERLSATPSRPTPTPGGPQWH